MMHGNRLNILFFIAIFLGSSSGIHGKPQAESQPQSSTVRDVFQTEMDYVIVADDKGIDLLSADSGTEKIHLLDAKGISWILFDHKHRVIWYFQLTDGKAKVGNVAFYDFTDGKSYTVLTGLSSDLYFALNLGPKDPFLAGRDGIEDSLDSTAICLIVDKKGHVKLTVKATEEDKALYQDILPPYYKAAKSIMVENVPKILEVVGRNHPRPSNLTKSIQLKSRLKPEENCEEESECLKALRFGNHPWYLAIVSSTCGDRCSIIGVFYDVKKKLFADPDLPKEWKKSLETSDEIELRYNDIHFDKKGLAYALGGTVCFQSLECQKFTVYIGGFVQEGFLYHY